MKIIILSRVILKHAAIQNSKLLDKANRPKATETGRLAPSVTPVRKTSI